MKHVFLSGRDGLDISAVAADVISMAGDMRVDGIRTVREKSDIEGAKENVYITRYGKTPIHDENHLVGVLWDDDVYTGFPEVFDRAGCDIMSEIDMTSDFIVLDEIGLYEMAAPLYSAAILKLLDGDSRVFGTMIRRDTPFHNAIRQNPETTVIEVADANKDTAAETAYRVFFE